MIVVAQPAARDIDRGARDKETLRPRDPYRGQHLPEDHSIDVGDDVELPGNREKGVLGHDAEARVLPAGERFDAGDAAGAGVEPRLVRGTKLGLPDPREDVVGRLAGREGFCLQGLGGEFGAIAAAALGATERDVTRETLRSGAPAMLRSSKKPLVSAETRCRLMPGPVASLLIETRICCFCSAGFHLSAKIGEARTQGRRPHRRH